MPYREPSDVAEERDPEALAIAEINKRAARLRTAIHVPLLLLGIAGGAIVYIVLRDIQFATRGGHMPWLTGVFAFVPCFGGSLRLAPRIADRVLRSALSRWRAELAKTHGLDPVEFAELTRLLG